MSMPNPRAASVCQFAYPIHRSGAVDGVHHDDTIEAFHDPTPRCTVRSLDLASHEHRGEVVAGPVRPCQKCKKYYAM